jgi:Ca2+-binding EF-hand superfamily protein
MTKIMTRQRATLWPGACVLALALLTSGCASGSSSTSPASSTGDLSSEEIYNEYDKDNNNNISQEEWDQAYTNMDSNGDGAVSRDEYNAAVGAGGGRR